MRRASSSAGLILLLLAGSGGAFAAEDPGAGRQPLAGRVIVLDPGHAVKNEAGKNINPGAWGRYAGQERDVVLVVAERLVPLLEAQGAKVYMTRTSDNPWRYTSQTRHADNRARALFANTLHADAYVRLHCDWNRNKKFKGFTIYYFRWGSRNLARSIRRAMGEALPGHVDHGLHRRTFVSVTSTMPAVLVELGVLSNRAEAKDLGSDGYKTRLAQAVSNGLVDYFDGPHRRIPVNATYEPSSGTVHLP